MKNMIRGEEHNLILRITALLLFLISTIVMIISKTCSSDTHEYSTASQYRFDDYKPFKYVTAANVIGCAYSIVRIIQLLIGLSGRFCFYLSLIFDQLMAYIVLSSASAAIGCIILREQVFELGGERKRMRYASASVSIQFMGFLVLAGCAVISASPVIRVYKILIVWLPRRSMLPILIFSSKAGTILY